MPRPSGRWSARPRPFRRPSSLGSKSALRQPPEAPPEPHPIDTSVHAQSLFDLRRKLTTPSPPCIRASRRSIEPKASQERKSSMEIGIDSFAAAVSDPATGITISPSDRLRNLLEEITLADQVGLDVFGIGEHHRT